MIEVGKSLIRIDSQGGNAVPCAPDVLFNTTNKGTVDGTQNINVFLKDAVGNNQTPISSTLVGNTLTIVVDIDTDLNFNGSAKGAIIDGTPINVNLQSSGGVLQTPISSTLVGNTLTIVVDIDTDIAVNSTVIGSVIDGLLINVLPVDNVTNLPISPSSTILAGNNLTLRMSVNTPSGVLLQFPVPEIYQSYQTGDSGYRFQNGWYNYTRPTNPAKVAELDLSENANWGFVLKNALTVNGISSKTRFVDVNGVQIFSATNNANVAVLDKLTGLLWYRQVAPLATSNWATAITNSRSYSVTINGVLYNEWYIPSILEMQMIWFYQFQPSDGSLVDPKTGVNLILINGLIDQMWSATTQQANVANALTFTGEKNFVERIGKGGSMGRIYVAKATGLIS